MADAGFSFTPDASPIVQLGLGDTRVSTGGNVWDLAIWDDPAAVWAGTEPSWWDVSCFAVEAEIARGRERATDRFVAGTAGIVLNNADGWADMSGSPLEVAAVSLRPGRAIRIGVDVGSLGVTWLFRGIIDRVEPTYDPIHPDHVKLDCVDLLGEVGHIKLLDTPAVGGDDTVPRRINRILDDCRHPAEKRVFTTKPFLSAAAGTVSTADVALPASFHFLVHARKQMWPSGVAATIASQSATPGQYGWMLNVGSAGSLEIDYSTAGTSLNAQMAVNGDHIIGGRDVYFGFFLDRPGGATHTYNGLGSDDGVTWTITGGGGTASGTPVIFDSTAAITIGRLAATGTFPWDGEIYWVELRTGVTPGAGTLVWRFDAADYPGSGTSYVDPRGRTWTLSEATAIVDHNVRVIQTTYGSQAVDLLGLAADSAGGVVYGDELGNIVYRDFGWQNYAYGTEPDGTIGNVDAGAPATPEFTPEPYLIDTGAPVTLIDTPTLTLPAEFTVFAKVRHPTGGTGVSFLCGQWSPAEDGLGPTIVESSWSAISTSRSPTVTFTAQPAENDIILLFPSSTTTTTITAPAGWASVLGGNTDVNADSCESAGLYHRVSAAEAVATKTYTLTDLYPVGQVGDVVGLIVRGVNTTAAIAGAGSTFDSSNTATPHFLAGVTPTVNGGLVIASIAKDLGGSYADPATGWTQAFSGGVTNPRWIGRYNTPSVSGAPIAATTITPSIGDEYTSITVVMAPTGVVAGGGLEWMIDRNRADGRWYLTTSGNGVGGISGNFTDVATPPTGGDEEWALSVVLDDASERTVLTAYRRGGGDDLNPLWFQASPPQDHPGLPWADRSSPISIGTAAGVTGRTWPGRIYSVELADAPTPTPPGATVWRFDVGDTTAGTTSWTDPRGRLWTVGGVAAGHVHPATIPAVPAIPGDICPAGWEVSYDRMDLATEVEINRQLPEPVPRLRYTLSAATGPLPATATVRFDNADQQAATVLRIHRIAEDDVNAEPFLRNITTGAELRLTDVGDATNQTRQYIAAGNAYAVGHSYEVPITWVEGVTGIGGVIDLAIAFVPPAPYILDDEAAQSFYGIEVFSLTDLISIDGARFPQLAQRVLATRGYSAMPRLEAVTLDAKAARGDVATMELMATCLPERPSRYLCRLRHEDGRMIFDRNMHVVGTRYHLSRDEWTVRAALDDAEWAASPHGEIVIREAGDLVSVIGTVT